MSDLLTLCREFSINNREIKEEGDEIFFENFAWNKDSKTNYVVWGSDKHGSVKEYYPLKSIVYFLKNANITHAQFVRKCAKADIPCIRLPDRQKLIEYLNGKIATCDSIDHGMPFDISQRRIIDTSKQSDESASNSAEPPNKRLCTDSSNVLMNESIDGNNQRLISANKPIADANFNKDLNKSSNITATIPGDKLEILRAKFRANRQLNQKGDDEGKGNTLNSQDQTDENDASSNGVLVSGQTKSFSSSKLQYGATKHFVKEIISREYTWRTRESVLQSQKKTFFDSVVMGVLKSVKLKEENLHNHGSGLINSGDSLGTKIASRISGPHTPFIAGSDGKTNVMSNGLNSTSVGKTNGIGNIPGSIGSSGAVPTHYSRYDQERFTGAGQDTAGFKIDTMGSYHGKGLSSMMTSDGTMNRDPRRQNNPANRPGEISKGGVPTKTKPKSRVPIIIIPAAPTSLITMYNARDILQELRFERTEDKKSAGCRRDNDLLIQRQKSDGRTVPYRIIDQPNKLNREDWDRVVAVFVQGPAWQFKNWPIGRDPVEIFNLVKAFHLKWAHMPIHSDVEKWNVHVIQLDNRRHLDKANFQQIWDILDRHMIKMKPDLRF